MAEKNLQEALLEETIINREIAEDTQGEISDLSSYFRGYFKDLRNDRLRQMEKDREGQRVGGGLKNLNDSLEKATDIQKGIGGILGLLLGIPTFIAAFVGGIVQGIKDTLNLYRVVYLNTLGRLPVFRELPAFFRMMFGGKDGIFTYLKNIFVGVSDTFRRISFNFSRGFNLVGKEATAFGKTSVLLVKDFSTFAGKVGAFFRSIVDIPKKLMPAVDAAGDAGRSLSAGFAPIVNGVKEIARLGGFIINPFLSMAKVGSSVTKEVGGLGKSVQTIGNIANQVVTTLRTFLGGVGRFIFGPITLIAFALFDAFKGAREMYAKFDNLGALLLGAVSGVINGFIFAPLDLLKNIGAFIIGMFNPDLAEAMKDFSFQDWWKGITEKVIQALMDLGGFIGRKIGELFSTAKGVPQIKMPEDLNNDGKVTPEEAERYKKLNPSRATATAQMEQATTDAKAAEQQGGGVTAVDASDKSTTTNNSASVHLGNKAPATDPKKAPPQPHFLAVMGY